MQQLDIFADSAPVQRANDLIAALTRFDRTASRQTLQSLTAIDPHHTGLPRFQVLCNFIDHFDDSFNNPGLPGIAASVAAEEPLIREQIIPASRVMGKAGDELVRRCWDVLAKVSEGAGIAPEQGNCFAAELYLRAQRFQDAVRTAQKIPGAEMRATVQRWLGIGYFGCREAAQARRAALRYAWLAPQQFNVFVDELDDRKLARDWNSFQHDLDELDATWFPAWCAHEKNAGAPILDNFPAHDGSTAYRLVTGLAIRERSGIGRAVYEDRARLKQLNESFFNFYMERRAELDARKI